MGTVIVDETKLIHAGKTDQIIGACIEVHRHLGPGLLESAYESCLAHELASRGVPFTRQVDVPIVYKGLRLDSGFRADLFVFDEVVLELKSVDKIVPIHFAQLLSYMKLANRPVGLIVNFNVTILSQGIFRRVL